MFAGLYSTHAEQTAQQTKENVVSHEVQRTSQLYQVFPWLGEIQNCVRIISGTRNLLTTF